MPQPFADQFRSIAMSPDLVEALERAHGFAREQGHRAVTLEHLLLAFTEDVDASAVLEASDVDLVRLGTDVSGYLGRLLEDMRAEAGAEPATDPELLRVLHAAVQAAQQSRRRQIDGAIVLAAVVGDGKSPAAGLLKAHGLTFEEAIRALQKANAKASAQARSKQFATPASASAPSTPENGGSLLSPQTASSEAGNSGGTPTPGQSVDEILAAARARIQQRSNAIVGKADELAQAARAEPEHPPPASSEGPQALGAIGISEKLADNAPASGQANLALGQSPPVVPPTPPGALATSASANAPIPSLPQAPAHRPQVSPPPQPQQLGDGPPRLPFPHRTAPRAGTATGPFNRPPRDTRPDRHEPAPPPRLPPANGALADGTAIPARRPGPRTGGQSGPGPLVETIPRRMRVGVPASAQVRISRDRIDGLILLLMRGRGLVNPPESLITRTLSIRLRAPNGGFWIEATSPETQWIETASGFHQDDHVTWRWTITPRRRGRGRLVLAVAARTVGQDGLAADMAPPDRMIEVTVTGGLGSVVRWGGLLVALIVGALIGRFGGEFWALGGTIMKRLAGG